MLSLDHTIPSSNNPPDKAFLKHYDKRKKKKKKTLITSILSFSHNVCRPVGDRNHHDRNICHLEMFLIWSSPKKNICHFDILKQVYMIYGLTHYQTTNFRLFQLKEFADDNFKFDENGSKLSKWVENIVGKGEIARYEQSLLFPVFSKGLLPRGVKRCHYVGMG